MDDVPDPRTSTESPGSAYREAAWKVRMSARAPQAGSAVRRRLLLLAYVHDREAERMDRLFGGENDAADRKSLGSQGG